MIDFKFIEIKYNLYFLADIQDGYSLRFWHEPTKSFFRYIPYGKFIYGLSSFDIRLLPKPVFDLPISIFEMTPSLECHSGNFLISESPILSYTNIKNERIILYENIEYFRDFCAQHACDIPTEHQIEFVFRRGSNRLFPFHVDYSSYEDFVLNFEKKVKPWMNAKRTAENVNLLGVGGLFFSLWTRTIFSSRKDICFSENILDLNDIAVRSGSAEFWPWQSEEWTWCIPSHRFQSSELPNSKAASFLIINLT